MVLLVRGMGRALHESRRGEGGVVFRCCTTNHHHHDSLLLLLFLLLRPDSTARERFAAGRRTWGFSSFLCSEATAVEGDGYTHAMMQWFPGSGGAGGGRMSGREGKGKGGGNE